MIRHNEEQIPREGLDLMKILEVKESEMLAIKVELSEKMDDLNALVKTRFYWFCKRLTH
jgi:hypothetical protein